MTKPIKIAIGEPCPIIRSGIEAQVRKLARYKVQQVLLLPLDNRKDWQDYQQCFADVFILNPLVYGLVPPRTQLSANDRGKFVALSYGTTADYLFKDYDAVLRITDSVGQIANLFDHLIVTEENTTPNAEEGDGLTPREKEVVVCIVKGMTNKEIATKLYLSPHTVITHRRNISKKLQIHSPSGLTIYAIMNKLIELSDIKGDVKL